jgi:hypothetical protein
MANAFTPRPATLREGTNRASARIVALNNGNSGHSSGGRFYSIYHHEMPMAAQFTTRLSAPDHSRTEAGAEPTLMARAD